MARPTIAAVAALTFACATAPLSTARMGPSPIAQLDHIMFLTPQPKAVISLLTDTLQLPLIWPAPGDGWSNSSGIAFGNTNLEIVHRATDTAFVSSLALQARDWSSVESDLRKLGVEMRDPVPGPIDSARSPAEPRWTVRSFRGFGRGVFVMQYHQFDMDERRARAARELVDRGGGALGVVRMREAVVAAESLTVRAAAWMRLFGRPVSERLSWAVGDGPKITVVDEDDTQRDLLIVEVRSIARARHVLDSLGIRYAAISRELRLDPGRTGGLRLTLLQAAAREAAQPLLVQ